MALTGPESCGKTTLAKQLTTYFHGALVLEYARQYLEKTQGKYEFDDLEKIARGQVDLLQQTMLLHPNIIFTDTELTVIKIWSEFKYHKIAPWIQDQYEKQNIDLYLLCRPDLPWEDDPLRESKNDRQEIFELYLKKLDEMKRNYRIVSGKGEKRQQIAIEWVKELL